MIARRMNIYEYNQVTYRSANNTHIRELVFIIL